MIVPYELRRRIRLGIARFRPWVIAGLVGVGVVAAVQAARADPPPTRDVVVAASDLAAGTRLTTADVTVARWPVEAVPDGAASGVGAVLAGPMRRGEPVTDAALLGAGLLTGQPAGTLLVPVTLADATLGAVLAPGDLVDLYAVAQADGLGGIGGFGGGEAEPDTGAGMGAGFGAARLLGSAVRVLASGSELTEGSGGDGVSGGGVAILVAASPATAARLAAAVGSPVMAALHVRERTTR